MITHPTVPVKLLFPKITSGFPTDRPNRSFTIITLLIPLVVEDFHFCFSWSLLLHHLQITGSPRTVPIVHKGWGPLKYRSQFKSLSTCHAYSLLVSVICYTFANGHSQTLHFFSTFSFFFFSPALFLWGLGGVGIQKTVCPLHCLAITFPYFNKINLNDFI